MLATVLTSILSACIVGVITHQLTIKRKRKDELMELRLKAYTDFILATSRLVSARRTGNVEDSPSELALLNDAKTRICLFSEPDVVVALEQFWGNGATLEVEQELQSFTRFCYAIRASLGFKENDLIVHEVELSRLLFKLEPSKFSFSNRENS
ncbi:hypothetical protein ACI5C3_004092 [Vibrio vulnificus]